MTLAILCSGQGPQHSAMFAVTGDAAAAGGLFAHAASLLDGRDPRDLVRTQPPGALHENREGQILCALQALAAAAVLGLDRARPLLIAGYSVGEVAAWGVAGLIDSSTALDLVARRAEVMDAASEPGDGLLFVRGLPQDVVEDLCRRKEAAIAILNPDNGYVIGGSAGALEAFAQAAAAAGAARVVRLAVNVASHTPRLADASTAFSGVLGKAVTGRSLSAGVRLFSGIDGEAVFDVGAGAEKLAAQISHTVRWAACLDGCVEAGATRFLELGPGRALAHMAAGAHPGIEARSLEDFRTAEGARRWLG